MKLNVEDHEVAIILKWEEGGDDPFMGIEVFHTEFAIPQLALLAKLVGELVEGPEYEDVWDRLRKGYVAREAAIDARLDTRYEN